MQRPNGKFVAFLMAFVVLAMIATLPLQAQEVSSLNGTVTDTSGAVIQGANLTLVNTRTNNSYQATTTSAGVYSFTKLIPGPGYKLTVKKDGFESIVINDLYLAVGNTKTEDVQMKVGQISESVEVSAQGETVTLNTTDATVGGNFNMNAVQQLPVQIRDSPTSLLTLQPGVVSATGGSDSLSSRAGAVTGARGDQNNVTLDGLDVNDFATGQAFSTVANAPVDSIQEFRAETAGSLAAEGRGSGGQIKMVTVGGTNTFHGGAWDYHRDSAFAANSWFNNNNATPISKPKLVRNQFGAKIGGPVFKDKLFFFFNYNGRRESQAVNALTIVPLDSFRNGNVSYILNTCGAASRQNTTPQCIGSINPTQIAAIDPQHVGVNTALLNFINERYPHANDLTAGDGINTGGFRFNSPVTRTANDYVTRVDYNMSDSMKLFGRFSILRDRYGDSVNYTAPVRFPGDPLTKSIANTSYAYVIGHTWTLNPTMVNQFTYGKTVSKLAFPTSYNPAGTNYFTFGGGATIAWTNPYYNQSNQGRVNPIPVFRDDFTWQKGSHQIQFGGMFKPIKTNSFLNNDNNFPKIGLGGLTSGLSASLRPADIRTAGTTARITYDSAFAMMLGRIASIDSNYNYDGSLNVLPQGSGARRNYRYWETESYIQDTWKATPSLTFTYGLRYQYYSVPYEVNGIEAIPNLGFDELLITRQGQGIQGLSGDTIVPNTVYDLGGKANDARGLYQANKWNFAPRFSFAYSPSADRWLKRVLGDKNSVIRGGIGIVYDHPTTNALNFIQDQNSYMFQSSTSIQYGAASATTALLNDPRFTSITSIPSPEPAPVVQRPFTPFVDSSGIPFGTAENEFNYAIDPKLKTPYSIVFNFGIQRELPGHFLAEATYVGRLGRRLIAQADASQLVDFRDPVSGQLMSAAFAGVTQAVRAGQFDNAGNYTGPVQPWFESQVGAGGTAFLAEGPLSSLVEIGDVADTVQQLYANGLLASNIGMPNQFAGNTYITNKGSSNYHGLLLSLHRNYAAGLQFDLNYTFSHSIDNTSQIANSISSSSGMGFVCDALNLRTCRGNSDFDIKHIVTADFIYELPFGKSKRFGSGVSNLTNQLIGGWSISGIPVWRSGIAFTTLTEAYLMGYANNSPAIFVGNRGDVKVGVHKTNSGSVTLFDNPENALAAFESPTGFNIGSRNNLRGPGYFNVDLGLAKKFPITERWNIQLRADAFNAFNHASFGLPGGGGNGAGADINSGSFGQITSTASTARVVQVSARIDF